MIRMAIGPIGQRDDARTRTPDQLCDDADVRWISADPPIRQPEIRPPPRTQCVARALGLGETLLGSSVAPHLSGSHIAQTDGVAERRMLCDRATNPDLDV